MNTRGRWRIGALASAVALLASLASLEAHALALGRITVQSALGEPLRAEIDIADINVEEAASLRAGVASSETFKASGLEYTAVAANVEVRLMRRPDGRAYLRLTSSRPISEPFVDLILDASWSTGRVTRDYTMLFDPPNMRSGSNAAAVAPTAPVLSRPVAPIPAPIPAPAPAPIAAPSYTPPPPVRPVAPPPVAAAPAPRPLPAAPAAPSSARSGEQVVVRAGDTAGKIAAQNKPASVSLDQMLVALLRSNPDAFIGGNINRVKSGAVLNMPTAEAASAVSAGEASQTIVAQSKDFNSFRRKLADSAPAASVATANRAAGGKVQANVEDRSATSTTPDKLTLSKGAVQGKAATAAEEKIAQERRNKEAATRVAELSKNINDLNKLGAPSAAAPATGSAARPAANGGTAAPAAAASAARVPGVAITTPSGIAAPATPAVVTTAPVAPATTPSPASTAVTAVTAVTAAPSTATASAAGVSPAQAAASAVTTTPAGAAATAASPAVAASAAPAIAGSASAPAAAAAPVVRAAPPPPAPVAEPSFLDELLENPLVLPLLGGLLLLLAAFGLYRVKQRNNPSQVDSSFLESRLQPDSFFGASGGQRIDTNEGNVTGSSLVYSPSQLDAAGDVDPVAEADVYLAYGRDLQAEEILKEALRTSPLRVAIHAKLLEIYAKRRDSKAFEMVAGEAFNLTHGNGPEWAYITEMGRELDPDNAMYQPGGQPTALPVAAGTPVPPGFNGPITVPVAPPVVAAAPSAPVDFDLDLDFSLDDPAPAPASAALPKAAAPAASTEDTHKMAAAPAGARDLDMDFGIATIAMPSTAKAAPAPAPVAPPPAARPVAATAPSADLDFHADGMDFNPEAYARSPAPAPAPAVADSGMLEFDLGSLSLDLDSKSPPVSAKAEDPLETKFQLAEEFRALGDSDGARSLAEEVLAKASGPLKVKAQAFLNALS